MILTHNLLNLLGYMAENQSILGSSFISDDAARLFLAPFDHKSAERSGLIVWQERFRETPPDIIALHPDMAQRHRIVGFVLTPLGEQIADYGARMRAEQRQRGEGGDNSDPARRLFFRQQAQATLNLVREAA